MGTISIPIRHKTTRPDPSNLKTSRKLKKQPETSRFVSQKLTGHGLLAQPPSRKERCLVCRQPPADAKWSNAGLDGCTVVVQKTMANFRLAKHSWHQREISRNQNYYEKCQFLSSGFLFSIFLSLYFFKLQQEHKNND